MKKLSHPCLGVLSWGGWGGKEDGPPRLDVLVVQFVHGMIVGKCPNRIGLWDCFQTAIKKCL